MLRLVNPSAPFEGLGTIFDDIGKLLKRLLAALAEGIRSFIQAHLTDADAIGPAVELRCPTIDQVHIPPFFAK